MLTMTATYSPDDNKLRLYASSRLDAETYKRVNDAGFRWAPKQDLFVAPMWTPGRENLLLELCGEIGDEDKSLVERAEERADRFDDYSDKRAGDAQSARLAVSAIADHIPFGQPILIGHHSERRARKDAERIENGMRRAVKMWETSEYWKQRAAGALRNAKYKERADVRHRRVKGLEADKRKQERTIAESEKALSLWQAEGLTLEKAKAIANFDYVSCCFPLAKYPRNPPASQYEGQMSLWSALSDGVINETQARDIAVRVHTRTITHARRWLAHYENRISYERAMLNEQGGTAADRFAIEVGGRVLIGGEWLVVLRVNKVGDTINSVTTNARYVSVRGIEEVKDYRAPSAEDVAKVKAATKLPPLVNYPGEGFLEMTAAEWKRKPNDYKSTRKMAATAEHGAYRYRCAFLPGSGYKLVQVYITDAKRVDRPAAPAEAPAPVMFERERKPVAAVSRPAANDGNQAEAFKALREQLKEGVQVVTAPQLFPTPADLAARMVELAEIEPGHVVLEPSAGTGNILGAIREAEPEAKLVAVEIEPRLVAGLNNRMPEVTTVCGDFLRCGEDLGRYDRVLMNPPFAQAQDIAHIKHALQMLKPGGRLVAICANGPRQNAKLRPLVEQHGGEWQPLPPDSFAESGTAVNTVLLSLTA